MSLSSYSSSTANAVLEAARKAKAPVMIQVSNGGGSFLLGKGVKDPNAIVKAHLENVAKWEKIYAKTGDDPAKFAQALWDEVYSKINPDKL